MRKSLMMVAAVLSAACAKGDEAATPMKPGSDSASGAAPAGGAAATADPDRATGGGGAPAGFMARVDSNPNQPIGDMNRASYTRAGDMWVVKTGPHHLVWAPGDSASGNYTVTARLQQMENPSHREAYGVFVGGRNLDRSAQQYLYFVVGGTGEYMISRRDSTKVTQLKSWTANNAVPKRDSTGKADQTLAIRVAADSVRFMINDTQVAALPKSGLPTDGVAGIRIGHNLHLTVQPVRITR